MSEVAEKTISLDSARLFRVKTVLLPLEGLSSVSLSYTNPVEIRSAGRRLGWASLSVEGDRLVAGLVFSYSTPERFSIETGASRLYARIEGVVSYDVYPFEMVGLYDGAQLPTSILVLGLELTQKPGFDTQPYLGEVLL